MSVALLIAVKDLRQRLRDRSAIFLGVIAPLVVSAVMSLAFSGTESFHMSVAYVDRDGGAIAKAFHDVLVSRDLRSLITLHVVADEKLARNRVDTGSADVAFVVPAGFTSATISGRATGLSVLTSANTRISAQVASSIAASFTQSVDADRLAVATAIATGAPAASATTLAARVASRALPTEIAQRKSTAKTLKPVSYYAPAMTIFFVLFAVGFAARSFFDERRNGMLDRMVVAPVKPRVVLLGKVLSVFVYAMASLLTVLATTVLAFGADWGDPLGVLLLCFAMAVAVVALAAFVITLARTEQQAQTYSSIVTFTLAVLGGNFVSIAQASPVMRKIALGTPNGWALRGFVDLATGERGWNAVGTPVLAILAFSGVVGTIALARSGRLVQR